MMEVVLRKTGVQRLLSYSALLLALALLAGCDSHVEVPEIGTQLILPAVQAAREAARSIDIDGQEGIFRAAVFLPPKSLSPEDFESPREAYGTMYLEVAGEEILRSRAVRGWVDCEERSLKFELKPLGRSGFPASAKVQRRADGLGNDWTISVGNDRAESIYRFETTGELVISCLEGRESPDDE